MSVIIPFLNPGPFLQEAIDSVFAQTYAEWELQLVNDGSTDVSAELARECARRHPGRVRYVEHAGAVNLGTAASRNLGIRRAKGLYIALLDADDVWLPMKLEHQVAALRAHRPAAMVYGPSQYWWSWTGRVEDTARDGAPAMATELGIVPDTVVEPPWLAVRSYPLGTASAPCPSSLLFSRELALRVGGFDASFHGIYQLYEDQTFLVKVYLQAPILVQGSWLDRHRQHAASCEARVIGGGHYDEVRKRFLRWLASYLTAQGWTTGRVWSALEAALEPYGGFRQTPSC